ncbi:DUF222 domain-containing protein [Actinomadura sp. 9N407]|uniref:HNH endonuclease signature motif containing protein n=1 Tax=Actinomadura sp. 9N407 TaxID=3375154 RepID=UPI0037B06935
MDPSALSTQELVEAFSVIAFELAGREVPGSPAVCMDWAETLIRAGDVQEGVLARLIGVVDRAGEVRRWGLPSVQAWLRSRLGMRDARAKERVLMARQWFRLPEVAERLADGSLSFGHAVAITGSVARLDDDDCARAEKLLLEMADDGFSAGKVAAFGSRIRDVIAERDGTDEPPADAARGYERSWIASTRSLDGGRHLQGWLNPEDAAVFDGTLAPLAKPTGPEDPRDLSERTAAALSSVLSGGHRATKVTLIIDLETLTGGPVPSRPPDSPPIPLPAQAQAAAPIPFQAPAPTPGPGPGGPAHRPTPAAGRATTRARPSARLPDGTPIPAEQARRIALAAGVSPLLLGPGGIPLYLGRRARFASPAQRRVLEALYPTCAVRGCEVPGTLCEIDHVDGWALDSGRTDVDRLALTCGWHNRWKHTNPDQMDIQKGRDGRFVYRLLPPKGHWSRRPRPSPWEKINADRQAAGDSTADGSPIGGSTAGGSTAGGSTAGGSPQRDGPAGIIRRNHSHDRSTSCSPVRQPKDQLPVTTDLWTTDMEPGSPEAAG